MTYKSCFVVAVLSGSPLTMASIGAARSAVNPATGNVYHVSEDSMSWADARAWAQGLGGDLAAIGDEAEQAWLTAEFDDLFDAAWIGFHQDPAAAEPDGGWAWASGQPVTYTAWAPISPDNGDAIGDEDFAVFQGAIVPGGAWDDKRGVRPFRAIAEIPASSVSQGYAMEFDGRDDWILVDHRGDLTFDIDTDSYTIEVWATANPDGAEQQVLQDRFSQSATPYNLTFYPDQSRYVSNSWYGTGSNTNYAVVAANGTSPGSWQHIAVTFDATTGVKRLYIDGALVGAEDQPALDFVPNTDGLLTIGAGWYPSTQPGNFFDGMLDELRIWSVVRTPQELRSAMNRALTGNEAGLAAYYTFEEGTGDILIDRSGNGHHGRLGATVGPDASDPRWVTWAGEPGCPVDLTDDGVLDIDDVLTFLNLFAAGCP